MAGLPKKYAKMGFKRGWAAYNRSKKRSRSSTISKGGKRMARRKRYSKRRYGRKGGVTMGGVMKVLTGAVAAGLYEVFLSPMIPIDGMMKNIVELIVGLILAATPGMPMIVKSFGAALATVNAYALVVSFLPGSSSGSTASSW